MRAKGKVLFLRLFCLFFVFLVSGCGGGGGGGGISGDADDTTAPTTPTGLFAEADTSTTVYLCWNASTDDIGIAGYLIFRNGVKIQDLYDPEYLEYDDAGLSPDTTYSYSVCAYDPTGNQSPLSVAVEVTTRPIMVVQFGTTADDSGRGAGLDASGNVYVAGVTTGSLGAANLGQQDAYVRKFNRDKKVQWTIQVGTTEEETVNGIAVEPNGNLYIAGSTNGQWKYQSVATDCFLAKYNSDGDEQWVLQPFTVWTDYALGVAVDSANNRVYLTGMTTGVFEGANLGSFDIFLAQYDLDGSTQWVRQLGTSTSDWASAIALDVAGNAYITGQTNEDLDGAAGSGTHFGSADAFLLKYDSAGALQWVAQWGTTDFDYGTGVAVDGSGNIYVTGVTEGPLGGTSAGSRDVFLARFDPAGNQIWIKQTGSSHDDDSHALAISSAGNIYITGSTLGIFDDIGEGGSDLFLIVYDTDGNLLNRNQGGSSGNEAAGGIALDSANSCLYMTGETNGGMDGNTNTGGLDALLIKMSFEGELL